MTTSEDYAAEIMALRKRHGDAERALARAEADRDRLQAVADTARQQLAAEFGVTDLDSARTLLANLQATLDADIAALRGHLDEMGV